MMNPLPVVRAELRRASASAIAAITLVAVAVALGVAVTAQERALRVGSARAADPFDIVVGRGAVRRSSFSAPSICSAAHSSWSRARSSIA
jgi:hypothetical protein